MTSVTSDPLDDRERLWALLTTAELRDADGGFYLRVADRLQTAILRVYFGLDTAKAHDLAVDAVERGRRAAASGRLNPDGNIPGYLLVIARNAAISELRRRKDESDVALDSLGENMLGGDDDVARIVERRATAESFMRVLRRARDEGDPTVFRLVTYLLNQAEETGRVPSNRAAGEALGLSHTGVAKALARFRVLLEASWSDEEH